MKLFLILFVGTKIGGTWGPLPYGMAECQSRAAEGNAIVEEAKGKPEVIAKLKSTGASAPLEQWRFVCEEHETRPPLASDAK